MKKILLLMVFMGCFLPSARAQLAPGSHVGEQLFETNEQPMDTLPDLNVSGMDDEATTMENNPCPEPKKAMGETPDDLAKIQEDITRFTLCVQRAQLLERLNELAKSNIETIDGALNLVVQPEDSINPMPNVMPSVPMPALSDDVIDDLDQREAAPSPAPAPRFDSGWLIRDIKGKGGRLTAQLAHMDGTFLTVKVGDDLPGNGGRVVSVRHTGVQVEFNGRKQSLQWVE